MERPSPLWRGAVSVRLIGLGYEWITPPRGRYGVGLRWRCMVHDNGSTHLVAVFFVNPTDGGPAVPEEGALAVWQFGGTPQTFTFVTPAGGDTLDFGECGRLRIISGRVDWVR